MTCKPVTQTVTVNGKKKKLTRQKCTTRMVSGPVMFTTTLAHAKLSRGTIVYATGTAYLTRVRLHARRAVPRGRYTLTLIRRVDKRVLTTTREVTITSG